MSNRNRTDPDWEDVRVFLALTRTGTLSGAARALGVNHATIARRLARLQESAGGNPLIDKAPEGYVLTEAGRAAAAEAERMEAAAVAFVGRMEEGAVQGGLVRISTLHSFAEYFLAPRLADLQAEHPGLRIDLLGEDRNVSFGRGEADLALRFGRPESGPAHVRRLADVVHRLYARPGSSSKAYIGFGEEHAQTAMARCLAELAPPGGIFYRLNSLGAQREAAAAGAGIALLPCYLGDSDSRLVRVEGEGKEPLRQSLWLMTRPDSHRIGSVRVVAERIADWVQRARPLLEGR